MKHIPHDMLVPLDLFNDHPSLGVQIAYKYDQDPNIFGVIYREGTRLWLYYDLARVTVLAARLIYRERGYKMIVYDGLRTVEAQALMLNSDIVRANRHWVDEEPRLLSPPGGGGHPRGMAVDVSLTTQSGRFVDMGTDFDYLSAYASADKNPAHRQYPHLPKEMSENRDLLNHAMVEAAARFNYPLWPLPQEWWDFRVQPEVYNNYAPLSDKDLPPQMQMCDQTEKSTVPDFDEAHFEDLKQRIEADIAPYV